MPIRKLPGAKTGETNVFKQRRTPSITPGGMSSAAYHCAGNRTRNIREKRSRKPLFPSTTLARTMPATLGPRSMTGNISKPAIFGTASPRKSFGAATASAPIQEIV